MGNRHDERTTISCPWTEKPSPGGRGSVSRFERLLTEPQSNLPQLWEARLTTCSPRLQPRSLSLAPSSVGYAGHVYRLVSHLCNIRPSLGDSVGKRMPGLPKHLQSGGTCEVVSPSHACRMIMLLQDISKAHWRFSTEGVAHTTSSSG